MSAAAHKAVFRRGCKIYYLPRLAIYIKSVYHAFSSCASARPRFCCFLPDDVLLPEFAQLQPKIAKNTREYRENMKKTA